MNYKEIYLNNNYEIDDNFTFSLKDIEIHKDKDLFKKSFAIITAFNPNNEILRCIENQDRHLELKEDIKILNLYYTHARGYLEDHSEDGYLIYDLSFEEAINLAKKYEQYAIFYNNTQNKKIGYYKCIDNSVIIEKTI